MLVSMIFSFQIYVSIWKCKSIRVTLSLFYLSVSLAHTTHGHKFQTQFRFHWKRILNEIVMYIFGKIFSAVMATVTWIIWRPIGNRWVAGSVFDWYFIDWTCFAHLRESTFNCFKWTIWLNQTDDDDDDDCWRILFLLVAFGYNQAHKLSISWLECSKCFAETLSPG